MPTRCSLALRLLVGSLIELAANLLHLRVPTFARKPFKFACGTTRLINYLLLLPLVPAAGSALITRALQASSLLLKGLLLTTRQLFKPARGFRLLLLCLLPLLPLDCLVLVLHLIEVQLEQTGQFLLLSLATLTTTAICILITKRDLYLTEDCISRQKLFQRPLFGRQF